MPRRLSERRSQPHVMENNENFPPLQRSTKAISSLRGNAEPLNASDVMIGEFSPTIMGQHDDWWAMPTGYGYANNSWTGSPLLTRKLKPSGPNRVSGGTPKA